MATGSITPSFLDDPGYRDLRKWYRKNPIALYTGAGVSSASDDKKKKEKEDEKSRKNEPKYGMSGWDGLEEGAGKTRQGPPAITH